MFFAELTGWLVSNLVSIYLLWQRMPWAKAWACVLIFDLISLDCHLTLDRECSTPKPPLWMYVCRSVGCCLCAGWRRRWLFVCMMQVMVAVCVQDGGEGGCLCAGWMWMWLSPVYRMEVKVAVCVQDGRESVCVQDGGEGGCLGAGRRRRWLFVYRMEVKVAVCVQDAGEGGCLCTGWRWRWLSVYRMEVKVAIYCESNYYGPACSVFCQDTSNCNSGHFTCNAADGSKVCMAGWQGTDCKSQVDASAICPIDVLGAAVNDRSEWLTMLLDTRTQHFILARFSWRYGADKLYDVENGI